jgi:hypothetical protein
VEHDLDVPHDGVHVLLVEERGLDLALLIGDACVGDVLPRVYAAPHVTPSSHPALPEQTQRHAKERKDARYDLVTHVLLRLVSQIEPASVMLFSSSAIDPGYLSF